MGAGTFRRPFFRCMNAEPILTKIAQTFEDARLEVILVGNAAAALQGAPVDTRFRLHVPQDSPEFEEA